MSKRTAPPDAIRDYLSYDPDTGVFTWIKVPGRRIKIGYVAGRIDAYGYRTIKFRGRDYRAHHLAWLFVYGVWPDGDLDHKNNRRDDNWIDNLRPATNAQNHANQRCHRDNASGLKGVSIDKRNGRYIARITVDGRKRHLGVFDDAEEAARAYDAAARQHFGEFARTNFPSDSGAHRTSPL